MKHIYILATAMFATTLTAQNNISFETSENYQTGNIMPQNGWIVTDDGEGNYITNQLITTEKASSGTQSYKNGFVPEFGVQYFPIMGASKNFAQPVSYRNATVTFDMMVNESDGSIFEAAAFGIDANEEYIPVFDLVFDYLGSFNVITSVDYDMQDTEVQWTANRWHAIKIDINENQIKYYVDNSLIYTTPNFSKVDLVGLNFLHDNYSGDAFIDNIKVSSGILAVDNIIKEGLSIYPNPVADILNFKLNSTDIKSYSIFDFSGKQVMSSSLDQKSINVASLTPGSYVLKITGKNGENRQTKFIKK